MAMKKNKNKKKIAIGTAMVALSAVPVGYAVAAGTTSVNVNIQAIVVTSAIAASQNQSLNFGAFTTGGAGGTVAITPAGAATYAGVVNSPTPAPTEAIVQVKGKSWGLGIDMSVTNPSVAVSNGTATMKVNQFNISTIAAGPIVTGIAMTAPSVAVPIGATLTVGAAQPTGTYAGTFTVQVGYQ